jgi:hypothetical protein
MRVLIFCAGLGGFLGFSACNPNSIGRPCVNPGGQAVLGTQVSSPALECPSRLCLLQPTDGGAQDGGAQVSGYRATCTAECENNGDCEAETKAECKNGFVCAVATTTGKFCCRKLCVCHDDLDPTPGGNVDSDGRVITPTACDPAQNPNITCPNVKK